jgi:hypothetical protein
MLPATRDAAALASLEHAWLEPAIARLARGRIASLTLVTDGPGAATWTARRPSMAARLRANLAPRRFEPAGR